MAKFLAEYGEVRNEEKVVGFLKKYIVDAFTGLTDNEIKRLVSKSCRDKDTCRYFTLTYEEMGENEGGKEVMWVDTGYTDLLNNTVYIQFTMSSTYDGWTGVVIGTEIAILLSQYEYRKSRNHISVCNYLKKKLRELGYEVNEPSVCSGQMESEPVADSGVDKDGSSKKQVCKRSDIHTLYSKLMVPNSWNEDSLKGYIDCCISRINSCIKAGKSCDSFVIFNKDSSSAVFNSGLMDKYGKFILIMVYTRSTDEGVIQLMDSYLFFCESKSYLVSKLNFLKEDLSKELSSVKFCDSPMDLVFTGSIDDFDLDCRSRFEHCVEDRISRFPKEYQSVQKDVLCNDMIRAIKLGVQLNDCDRSYIKPIYSVSKDSVDFVIPYHIMGNMQEKPDLGIVVSYVDNYWQIMTILSREDVLKDIKAFNMYSNETF